MARKISEARTPRWKAQNADGAKMFAAANPCGPEDVAYCGCGKQRSDTCAARTNLNFRLVTIIAHDRMDAPRPSPGYRKLSPSLRATGGKRQIRPTPGARILAAAIARFSRFGDRRTSIDLDIWIYVCEYTPTPWKAFLNMP